MNKKFVIVISMVLGWTINSTASQKLSVQASKIATPHISQFSKNLSNKVPQFSKAIHPFHANTTLATYTKFTSPYTNQITPFNNFMPGLAMPTINPTETPSTIKKSEVVPQLTSDSLPSINNGLATHMAHTGTLQLAAWKKEITQWTPETKNWQESMKQIITKMKKLTISQNEKEDFIKFLQSQRDRLKTQSQSNDKPKSSITKEAKEATKQTPQPNDQFSDLKQSFFKKALETVMGQFGIGKVATAKKRAENLARNEENPEKLFQLLQGFTPEEQENILNAWVVGWRAQLIHHYDTPEYNQQLQTYVQQLSKMLNHMKEILPKSYEALLTSDNYTTNSIDHDSVKINILDKHAASEHKTVKVHSEGPIHIYHKDADWSDYIFSEALKYVKQEILAALRDGSTHQSS